jgi:carbamoyl-phosphate synthase large subunit
VIVQFGGQTPLNLAMRSARGGRADHRHFARFDRPRRRSQTLRRAADENSAFRSPKTAWRHSVEEAREVRERSVIRCWCAPSYVLGGRAMAIVYDEESLDEYVRTAVGFTPIGRC